MPRIWKIAPLKYSDLKLQLLYNRGLTTEKDIEEFFNPKLDYYQKEIGIPGIKDAQKRIKEAIEKGEQIIVYGDYDIDGIAASAILYKGLTSIGAKILPYIPHRDNEGYGLSKIGLDFARDSGASLVITVDNGIVAFEQAIYAKEIGLDLIITDHHQPLDNKPEAFGIVHSIEMCGAGVAWCLIQDIIKENLKKELLQFVCIATVGDMIPLIGLGRTFVVEGLKELNKTDNLGLLALMREVGVIPGQIGTYEIGHILGPRLNAIGRLEHAIDALRLLCTKDQTKARNLARLLAETNIKRQILTDGALNEARLMIDKKVSKKIYVLHSPNWASGIIGLVAARITEEYYRPAIALSVGNGIAKGSARSTNGVNIVEVIRKCSDLLIDVGGHKGAAGFSIKIEKLEEFKSKLEKIMDEFPEESEPVLEVEAEIESKKLSKSLVKLLDEFEPFGMNNPKPIFATPMMKVSDIRTLSEGKHLKFLADGIDAIAFGMGNMINLVKSGSLIDLAYNLEINRFNGSEKLQLKVKDLKIN